ncbi:rhodanese-like domain-containing protein [uncultured Arcticibacterium sp.]|uniref:rhodanese-like domain-containing protein n=1 Tax=uncultured Arcticibacterium sp. TaxID=2173042 RepID=UPI0030F94E1E
MKYSIVLLLLSLSSFGQDLTGLNPSIFQKAFKENPSASLLDLRSEDLFHRGHIKKAINLDYGRVDFDELMTSKFDKKQALFLYSSTTIDAKNASIFLKGLGFQEVYYLSGGFSNWTASSKPYVSSRLDTKPIAAFTLENLMQAINTDDKVFVFLSAPWCSHCKVMEPIIRKNTGNKSGIKLLKIDASKELAITEHFKATETPTFIYFNKGKQVWRYSGEIEENELQKVLFRPGR